MSSQASTLSGAWAKLRRANEHLDDFADEAARSLETVKATLVTRTRYDPEIPRWLLEVVDEPVISLRLSTIAGDVLHNLRSALDYLAYELVAQVTGQTWEDSQWPIVSTFPAIESSWRFRGLRDRLIADGRDDLWALVEYHQAVWFEDDYGTGDDIYTQRLRRLPLLVLAELSNRDKHRLLIEPYINVAAYTSVVPRCVRDCANPRAINVEFYTLKADAAPLWQFTADITGPDPQLEVDIDFEPQPVGLVTLPGDAHPWLVLMADAVREVLQDFDPTF